MDNTVSELYNKWILKLDKKYKLLNVKKNEFRSIYNISDLFLHDYNYDFLVPPLKFDKCLCTYNANKRRNKRKKRIKNVNSKKLLSSLPVLVAQIKAGNNSYNVKNKIRQMLCLLYQHNKITKKLYNNLIKSL